MSALCFDRKEERVLERIIFHVDVNSAFLSWEACYRLKHLGGFLDLRSIPSAICGDIQMRHGIVLAKSIPAKAYGIQTGMTVVEARQRCPELYMAPPNYTLYQKCSRAFLELLHEYTPRIEIFSIDEAFMDMTETVHLYGTPEKAACEIKDRIREELGFTVNIGVSSNKLLAKVAGELKKPDLVHTLFQEEISEKMWPLPVSELFFCGRASTKKLRLLGIHTIGELAATDVKLLRQHLNKHGKILWEYANGIDETEVISEPPPQKGYGNSTTLSFDVDDVLTARKVLLALIETVGSRLRSAGVKAEVVSVGIKSYDLKYASHQMILRSPTNITAELYQYACQLFEELWDYQTPIRHLAVYTSRLQSIRQMRQLDLFDPVDYEKLERMDRAVDEIRRKFGNDAVKRAVFLDSAGGKKRLDHMEGGISREKRTVDYTKLKIE